MKIFAFQQQQKNQLISCYHNTLYNGMYTPFWFLHWKIFDPGIPPSHILNNPTMVFGLITNAFTNPLYGIQYFINKGSPDLFGDFLRQKSPLFDDFCCPKLSRAILTISGPETDVFLAISGARNWSFLKISGLYFWSQKLTILANSESRNWSFLKISGSDFLNYF